MKQQLTDALGEKIRSHLGWFCTHAIWGEETWAPGLWWSQLELKSGAPVTGERQAGVSKRCYRWIESPGGSNLYWDLPLIVAMRTAAQRFDSPAWAAAGERYVRRYFEQGASSSGLLWWGNHYYLGHSAGGPVWFHGNAPPTPMNAIQQAAPAHETRPLPVPWALLGAIDRGHTLRNLAAHEAHLNQGDARRGFDRHASGNAEHPFLEAGAMLVLSQAWRAKLSGDTRPLAIADDLLRFSFGHRDAGTGLLPVSPHSKRWDDHQATSEIGLWAGAALAAAALCGQPAWTTMAAEALGAWLERAWLPEQRQFAGRLHIGSGAAVTGPQTSIYQPGRFSDPWEPLFPIHDYPLSAAEASLSAWQATGEARFATGARRWADVLQRSLPARNGRGGYAEHYGRVIHFFWRAGEVFRETELTDIAWRIAEESLNVLNAGPGLRTHPWEDRCEAVDGAGWLLLAWLTLLNDAEPDLQGMIW